MSKTTFLPEVKSTIDKLAVSLATSENIACIDLDDSAAVNDLFATTNTAILVEYNTLDYAPADPLYSGTVHIGVRVVVDPSSYTILQLMGKVQDLFPKGERILVRGSYGLVETDVVGVITPGDTTVLSQQSDMGSGIRMLAVDFKAMRLL
jgi:hypothetical protein